MGLIEDQDHYLYSINAGRREKWRGGEIYGQYVEDVNM